MNASLKTYFISTRATAAVEFAIIVPVLILLAAGITEYGRFFSVSDAANRLATQYAAAWSDCSDIPAGTCATELNTYVSPSTIGNFAPQLNASQTTISMFQVQMAGGAPTVVISYPANAALSADQITAAASALSDGQSGVIVTVTYAHTLAFFPTQMSSWMNSLLNISYTVVQLKG